MASRNQIKKGQRIGIFTGTGRQKPYRDKTGRLKFYLHEVICSCGNQFYIKWHLLKKQKGCKECKTGDVKERFFRHVNKTRGCWYWTGYITKDGIPIFSLNGENIPAYRLTYEWYKGWCVEGGLKRECGNKACVNPDHLIRRKNKSSNPE